MKRASYRQAIEFIALNDDPGSSGALDPDDVRGLISVSLVADIFNLTTDRVSRDVVSKRKKNFEGGDE